MSFQKENKFHKYKNTTNEKLGDYVYGADQSAGDEENAKQRRSKY